MKTSELKKLIREEVRKVLNEAITADENLVKELQKELQTALDQAFGQDECTVKIDSKYTNKALSIASKSLNKTYRWEPEGSTSVFRAPLPGGTVGTTGVLLKRFKNTDTNETIIKHIVEYLKTRGIKLIAPEA
jgi:DUF1009 family protein